MISIKKSISIILCVALAALVLCSCGTGLNAAKNDGKITVVVTSFPLYDAVRAISRDDSVELSCLLPWGADAHDYDPSIGDVGKVASADLFIYSGSTLENWADKLVDSAGGNARVVDVSEGIELLLADEEQEHEEANGQEEGEHHHEHGADPHIWTSPENMLLIAKNINGALSECNVADNLKYDNYVSEITKLSERCTALADKQKQSGKKLYFGDTFAFLYLMKEYGFTYMSVYPGCSDEVEPSIASVSIVTSDMKENKADVIFKAERSLGKVASETAADASAEVLTLQSCHNITASEAETGVTYVSLMTENLDNIEKAIG